MASLEELLAATEKGTPEGQAFGGLLQKLPAGAGYFGALDYMNRAQDQNRVRGKIQQQDESMAVIKDVLQKAGGDPEAAIKALLATGDPIGVEMAAKLKAFAPKPPEGFTLKEGERKYSPQGRLLAEGAPKTDTTLDPVIDLTAQLAKLPPDHPARPHIEARIKYLTTHPTPASAIEKPPAGYRRTPTGDLVAIPGGPAFLKESEKHSKDYQALLTANTKTDEGIKKINEILDPKKSDAFNSNFGGYNALATQYMPGETQDMRAKIESLKSDMKAAGLELIRTGGGIGQMTEREWPIVQDMIDRISPLMSEKQAKDAFTNVKAYLQRIRNNAENVYETEWSGNQLYKPRGKKAPDYIEIRTTPSGKRLGKRADGTIEEIK